MKKSLFIAVLSSALLSGCGSSDSSKEMQKTPIIENVLPIISASSISALEKTDVSLVAKASDPDGTIVTFEWVQTLGPTVEFENNNTGTLHFTAPAVSENTVLTFEVSVKDNNNGMAKTTVSINVISNTVFYHIRPNLLDSSRQEPYPQGNATISLTLSGEIFNIPYSANDYILVQVDDDFAQQSGIARIDIVGSGESTGINYRSYLGTTKEFLALATEHDIFGSNVINSSNTIRLLISNVTTAEAGLLEAVNRQQVISTVEDFEMAKRFYDSSSVLDVATYISFVHHGYGGVEFQFPEGINDAISFASSYSPGKAIHENFPEERTELRHIFDKQRIEIYDRWREGYDSTMYLYNSNDLYGLARVSFLPSGEVSILGKGYNGSGKFTESVHGVTFSLDSVEGIPQSHLFTASGTDHKLFITDNYELTFLDKNEQSGMVILKSDVTEVLVNAGTKKTLATDTVGASFVEEETLTTLMLDEGTYTMSLPKASYNSIGNNRFNIDAHVQTQIALLKVTEDGNYTLEQVTGINGATNEIELARTSASMFSEGNAIVMETSFGDISIRSLRDLAIDGDAKHVAMHGELTIPYSHYDTSTTRTEFWTGETFASGILAKHDTNELTSELTGWFKEDNTAAEDATLWYYFTETEMRTYNWYDANIDSIVQSDEVTMQRYALNMSQNKAVGHSFAPISSTTTGCYVIEFGNPNNANCYVNEELNLNTLQLLRNNPLGEDDTLVLSITYQQFLYDDFRKQAFSLSYFDSGISLFKAEEPAFIKSLNSDDIITVKNKHFGIKSK